MYDKCGTYECKNLHFFISTVAINDLSWIVPKTKKILPPPRWWLVNVEMGNGCLKILLICKKIDDDKFNDVLNFLKNPSSWQLGSSVNIEMKNGCAKFLLIWWKIYDDDFDNDILPKRSLLLDSSLGILKWKTDVSSPLLSDRIFIAMILITSGVSCQREFFFLALAIYIIYHHSTNKHNLSLSSFFFASCTLNDQNFKFF